MTCPVCAGKTTVVDSASDCESVYRQRKCIECNHKFMTVESETDDGHTLSVLKYQRRMRGD